MKCLKCSKMASEKIRNNISAREQIPPNWISRRGSKFHNTFQGHLQLRVSAMGNKKLELSLILICLSAILCAEGGNSELLEFLQPLEKVIWVRNS